MLEGWSFVCVGGQVYIYPTQPKHPKEQRLFFDFNVGLNNPDVIRGFNTPDLFLTKSEELSREVTESFNVSGVLGTSYSPTCFVTESSRVYQPDAIIALTNVGTKLFFFVMR